MLLTILKIADLINSGVTSHDKSSVATDFKFVVTKSFKWIAVFESVNVLHVPQEPKNKASALKSNGANLNKSCLLPALAKTNSKLLRASEIEIFCASKFPNIFDAFPIRSWTELPGCMLTTS